MTGEVQAKGWGRRTGRVPRCTYPLATNLTVSTVSRVMAKLRMGVGVPFRVVVQNPSDIQSPVHGFGNEPRGTADHRHCAIRPEPEGTWLSSFREVRRKKGN